MGYRISDLLGASLPLSGDELLELTQASNSRSVRVSDLLPGFENTLSAALAEQNDPSKGTTLIGHNGRTLREALQPVDNGPTTASVAAGNTASDNTTALIASVNDSSGRIIQMPAGIIDLNPIVLTAPALLRGHRDGTTLRLTNGGNGHLIESNSFLSLIDLVVDQNRQNNPGRLFSAVRFTGPEFYGRNVKFKNTMFAGVHVPNAATERLTLIDCDFSEMAEHSGVTGEQTQAVNCRVTTACKVVIRGGEVKHGTPSDVDAAPGGFIFDGAGIQSVEVTGVTFTNIGQRKASNFIGSVDLYSNCRDVTVHGNKVFNYYYVPFKFQNCQRVVMTGNTLFGAADAAANQAVVFQNARDFQGAITEFVCQGNILVGTSKLTDGIYIQGDPDLVHDTQRVVIANNILRSFRYGVNCSYVKNMAMIGGHIEQATEGVYIRDVIDGSQFNINGGIIEGCSARGILASGATGKVLGLNVSGTTFRNNTSFHIDANYASRLTVTGCEFVGTPTNDIRSQNNGFAVVTGNNNGTATASLSILTGTTKQAGNSWN